MAEIPPSDLLPVSVLQELGITDGSIRKKVREGKLTLSEVAKAVSPQPLNPDLPTKLPLPAEITPAQRLALEKLEYVYGSVVPDEKRVLSEDERAVLLDERKTLDDIDSLVKERKASIRTTVLNHLDVEYEVDLEDGAHGEYGWDKDGHWLKPGTATVPGSDEVFSWEIREGSPEITAESLRKLDEAGEIPHELYLKMTVPTRVVDEQAVLKLISQRPEEVLPAIRKAASSPTKTGSLNIRKAK